MALPQRRSVRLPGYDYRQAGAYYITLCTHNRAWIFGQITDDDMHLSRFGRIAEQEWLATPRIRSEVELDVFVIMPNHMHAVVLLGGVGRDGPRERAHGRAPLRRRGRSLGALVAGFKSTVTKQINARRRTPGSPVWQRNYYDRVVRSRDELDRIRKYVVGNPLSWTADKYNPANTPPDQNT